MTNTKNITRTENIISWIEKKDTISLSIKEPYYKGGIIILSKKTFEELKLIKNE